MILVKLFHCLYSTLFGPSKKILNHIPSIVHHVCDDEFVKKFDEIVIIGDIHGCYDEFILLLDQINQNIDPKKYRHLVNKSILICFSQRILKICAGDLVNKGPKSKEVIEYFLNHQECISVRGNHDQVVMMEYIKFIQTGEIAEKNSWLKELTDRHFEYLRQLPYTIKIPKLNVIIVHAGLLPNVSLENQQLNNMIEMRNIIVKEVDGQITNIATKEDTKGVAWASMWPGPCHVYFGHDAKRKLQEHNYATGLDTGVVYGNQLTAKFIMGPRKGQYLSVKALKTWKDPNQKRE